MTRVEAGVVIEGAEDLGLQVIHQGCEIQFICCSARTAGEEVVASYRSWEIGAIAVDVSASLPPRSWTATEVGVVSSR